MPHSIIVSYKKEEKKIEKKNGSDKGRAIKEKVDKPDFAIVGMVNRAVFPSFLTAPFDPQFL